MTDNVQFKQEDLYEVELSLNCYQRNTIYIKENFDHLSERKIRGYKKIAELQKYYQCNPVRFIRDFFGIELLDGQAWIIQNSWTRPNVLVLATRGYGKSTIIDLMVMAKGMLFSNYWTYIASGSGSQAQQTFITLEKLANDNIDTMVGSTGYIFKNELEVPNATGDGFTHSSDGFKYSLYNGALTQTLNSNIDRKRGIRGNVVFDETGWLAAEMLQTYAAFAVVSKSFKTGQGTDGKTLDPMRLKTIPKEIPYQVFYISSASSTDTEYYNLYRMFAKKMIMGDPNYFVAEITCEMAFHPTLHGKKIAPLLQKSTVEAAMKTNPEKGRREYYCQFTTDAGLRAIIKRVAITRNSEIRKPLLYNDTGNKKFIICYDPARLSDNSVVLIGELYRDKTGNYEVRLVNCVSMVDVHKKKRTPVTMKKQLEIFRDIILDYNQGGDEFYSNIFGIYIDAGSGGQANMFADFLMEDWTDSKGVTHKGLVDPEYYPEDSRLFPNAVKNKLHMMKPAEYKAEMFECLIQMVEDNHIKFTAEYDNKGYLSVIDIDKKKYDKARDEIVAKLDAEGVPDIERDMLIQQEMLKVNDAKVKTIDLDWADELALTNIDLVRDQIVNICRIKRNGSKDSFEIIPEKKNSLHDDHAYVLAMMGYALSEARKEKRRNDHKKPKSNMVDSLTRMIRRPKSNFSMFS